MAGKKRIALDKDIEDMLGELLPVPALEDGDIDPLRLLMEAPAEEFQKALTKPLRKLVLEGLKNMPAPKNYKELASVMTMFEKAAGLNKPDPKNAMPQGLVIPMRAVQRRIGAIPELPEPPPTRIELEADLADREAGLEDPPSPVEEWEV